MKSILVTLSLVSVAAVYQNASIVYSPTLECTSCIRGGYDFCLFHDESKAQNCSQHALPVAEGYSCSINTNASEPWVTDETTAIVQYCGVIFAG